MRGKVPKSQIPNEKQLVPGTKIFAKVKGNPYWPAKIELLPDEVSSKTRYKVIFYGTKETALLKKESMVLYNEETKKIHGKQKKRKFFNIALKEIEDAYDERINYYGTTTTTHELDTNNNQMNINSNDDKDEQSTDIHTLELNESKTSFKNQSEISNEEPDELENKKSNEPVQNVSEKLNSSFEHTSINKTNDDLENESNRNSIENIVPNELDSYFSPEKKQTSSKKRSIEKISTSFINLASAESFESSKSKKFRTTQSFTKLSNYANNDYESYFPIREVVLPIDFF